MTTARVTIKTYFRKLKDPRRRHGQHHRFLDIIVIAICAVIAGANTWTDIATFGVRRYDWLKRFLALPNGIPSHDTFERVFAHLDPRRRSLRDKGLRLCQVWPRVAKSPPVAEAIAPLSQPAYRLTSLPLLPDAPAPPL